MLKTLKCILILFILYITLFMFNLNGKAMLTLCAYGKSVNDPANADRYAVLVFENNRTHLLEFAKELGETNDIIFSPDMNYVHNYYTALDLLTIKWSSGIPAYYLSDVADPGSFVYDPYTGVYAYGKCAEAISADSFAGDSRVNFYREASENVKSHGDSNYYLYFSTVDWMYRFGFDTQATAEDQLKRPLKSGDLNVLNMFSKIDSGDICGLSFEQVEVLTNMFGMKYMTSGASGMEKHKLARYLGYNPNTSRRHIEKEGTGEEDPYNYFPRAEKIKKYAENEDLVCKKFKDTDEFAGLVEAVGTYEHFYDSTSPIPQYSDGSCETILGDVKDKESFAYYLQLIFTIIKYSGPILVIVLTTMDYIGAVTSGSAEAVKKVNSKTVTRIAAMLLLFVLPTLIMTVLHIFGVVGDCGIK